MNTNVKNLKPDLSLDIFFTFLNESDRFILNLISKFLFQIHSLKNLNRSFEIKLQEARVPSL